VRPAAPWVEGAENAVELAGIDGQNDAAIALRLWEGHWEPPPKLSDTRHTGIFPALKESAMRWVLLVAALGYGLTFGGVALALDRWDLTMDGGGTETWVDFLPFPMVLTGLPVALAATALGVGMLIARLVVSSRR